MIRHIRNALLAVTGLLSAFAIAVMLGAGAPRTAGEAIILAWAVAGVLAALLSIFVDRRPRAQNLGAAGERTP